ncbi:hypothetical protein D9M71_437260 [compost metagenome]
MAKAQRAHQQARDDLVADAQAQGGIEHVVRKGHGGRQRDHFTAGDTQLHAGLALGDAIAHGWHATGELTDRADLAQGLLDLFRVMLIRLVRREHVVVRRHDRHVGGVHHSQGLLVLRAAAGHAMGEVGTLQPGALRAIAGRAPNQLQVTLARLATTGDQPFGDFKNAGMHVLNSRLWV